MGLTMKNHSSNKSPAELSFAVVLTSAPCCYNFVIPYKGKFLDRGLFISFCWTGISMKIYLRISDIFEHIRVLRSAKIQSNFKKNHENLSNKNLFWQEMLLLQGCSLLCMSLVYELTQIGSFDISDISTVQFYLKSL